MATVPDLPARVQPDLATTRGAGRAIGVSGHSLAELLGCVDRFSLDEIKIQHPDEGLKHPAVWRCVNFLSETVGKLPISIRRTRSKAEDTNHPIYRNLRHEVNPWQTWQAWAELAMRHATYWGNSVSYIVRDQDAEPIGLIPFHPTCARLARCEPDKELRYQLLIDVDGQGAKWYAVDPENVVHIPGFSTNGLWGLHFWEYHAVSLGLAQTPRAFAGRYFARGTTPSGKVTIPDGLPPDEDSEEFKRYVDSFKKAIQGLGKSHNILFLEHGSDYEPVNHNAQDSQLLDVRDVSNREVCQLFGVDPTVVGLELNGPYKSLEEKSRRELRSVDPWLCRFENEFRKKLLTERQKRSDSHYVRFDRNTLIDMDVDSITKEIQSGGSTINEVRCKRGMEPVEGGDCVLLPSNVTTLDMICEGRNLRGNNRPDEPEDDEENETDESEPTEDDGSPDDEPPADPPGGSEANNRQLARAIEAGYAQGDRQAAQIIERRLTAHEVLDAVASIPPEKIQRRYDLALGFLDDAEVGKRRTDEILDDLIQLAKDSNNKEAFRKNCYDYCEALKNGIG